mmetsp:Transcript_45035/g.97815  ORF Transcript_45035/g.97815 Transcript_45035/m.97815 type:complete len:172 (+) Transcript_45035:110-625(+)|eukprot:CAMPEP_0170573978 /NCGR_PEP_ID=MMETSP0224-20130122/3054_1 /TAXON_ID=285029 /ORGANISM="Togula jolla, Strain CCCM 725" /LENGTH=171 /DNA_ID=CAMNT_0010896603 /DNA_START=53 /DNA_END=568 /DNA_ORIENTATION=-
MGQTLASTCCATSVESSDQVVSGVNRNCGLSIFVGEDSNWSHSMDVHLTKPMEEAAAPSPSRAQREDSVKEVEVEVSSEGSARRCLSNGVCPKRPSSPLRLLRMPQQGHSKEEAQSERSTFCNSVTSLDDVGWNSHSLLMELNAKAKSLSLEFEPLRQCDGTAFDLRSRNR